MLGACTNGLEEPYRKMKVFAWKNESRANRRGIFSGKAAVTDKTVAIYLFNSVRLFLSTI
jgi:hypothetical protein